MKSIATVGGIGYIPKLPGTAASLVGAGLSWLLRSNPTAQLVGFSVAAGLGFWSAGPTARALGQKDPPVVVIDEVAGMMLTLLLLPAKAWVYLAGFLLFRLLDIWKPRPICRLERLPGSAGIMLDDLLAGVIANLLLQGLLRLFSIS